LLDGWLAGKTLAEAMAQGVAAGGAAVGRIGGAPTLSDREARET
jgi:sugar/nucleoside kinase (ribokinase family)